MNIDLANILKILPHRPPFLFLDKVQDVVPLKNGIGVKQVTFDEELMQGAAPECSTFPNMLTLEMMAQTAAVVCAASYLEQKEEQAMERSQAGYLVSADITFEGSIKPGDTMLAKMAHINNVDDSIRRFCVNEPRGAAWS